MRLRTVILAAVAGGAYLRFGRPWVLNWGSMPREQAAVLPADELLGEVALQTTRAVTVEAPASAIWPWLVQMGPRPRAGVYTYDWIERRLGIDIENADRILPEFQHLEPGEFFTLDPKKGSGLAVRVVEPGRALVLQWRPGDSTWAFVIEPAGPNQSRLISRNRIPGGGLRFWIGMVLFMEAGSLVMERKMLLGIKARAERLHREAGRDR
jgi:hypothetical protein